MQLHNQPTSVIHLFDGLTSGGRYSSKRLKERIQLLFDCKPIGGWADDSNGHHWYVLETKCINLNPSFRIILEHFDFERIRHGEERHYWRVRGADGMWCFKRAIEEITGIPLLARL